MQLTFVNVDPRMTSLFDNKYAFVLSLFAQMSMHNVWMDAIQRSRHLRDKSAAVRFACDDNEEEYDCIPDGVLAVCSQPVIEIRMGQDGTHELVRHAFLVESPAAYPLDNEPVPMEVDERELLFRSEDGHESPIMSTVYRMFCKMDGGKSKAADTRFSEWETSEHWLRRELIWRFRLHEETAVLVLHAFTDWCFQLKGESSWILAKTIWNACSAIQYHHRLQKTSDSWSKG